MVTSPYEREEPKPAPPAYGSREYWERRYDQQFQTVSQPVAGEAEADDGTLPYHAWYFTYHDLRPLILPLILGGREESRQIMEGAGQLEGTISNRETVYQDESTESSLKTIDLESVRKSKKARLNNSPGSGDPLPPDDPGHDGKVLIEDNPNNSSEEIVDNRSLETSDEDDEGDCDIVEEECGSDSDTEEPAPRDGLANSGPISVIEIGCGDVPLGAGLALELREMESETGQPVNSIAKRIVCTDYSSVVVNAMKEQYTTKPAIADCNSHKFVEIGNVQLHFEEADARNLPYEDGTFELVLEKGTLDAMLSDKDEGVRNCISIVKESGRVLKVGGYIVLISHLNAHTSKGLGWLQDVVFEGLKRADTEATWEIEVHGNDEAVAEDSEAVPAGSPGPAVYIIQKKPPSEHSECSADKNPTMPVKFYSY